MVKAVEVLEMLRPEGGWVISGEEFEGISFISCKPLTKKEFVDGYAEIDSFKERKKIELDAAKKEILNRLGITEDEAKILLA